MKRTVQYLLSLCILVALASCGFSTSSEPEVVSERTLGPNPTSESRLVQTEEPADQAPAETPEPADPPQESAAFDGLYIDRVWLILTEVTEERATAQMWFFLSNNSDEPSPQLRLAMFPNAIDVFVDDFDYVVANEENQSVVVRRDPLPPQSNNQLLIVDYQLPADELTNLNYQIAYPTAEFSVYLPQSLRPQLEVPQLEYQGIRLLRGLGDFLLFTASAPILPEEGLTFDIMPASTIRYSEDIEFVDFSISVENGTSNAALPSELQLTILSVRIGEDSETLIEQRETSWGGEPLRIEQMPIFANGFIEVRALYNDITFWARLDALEALSNQETLTLTLYETTNDPSIIKLESVWYVVDAVTGEGLADYLVWYFFTNTSDRIYIGEAEDANLLELPLPPNIQGLNFQAELGPAVNVNFVDNVPYIVDNRLVFPQQRQVLPIEFFLPYNGELTLTHDIGYAADRIVVYVSSYRKLAFEGVGFESTGQEELPSLGLYESYTKFSHSKDDVVVFTIADTDQTPQVDPHTITNPNQSEENATTADFFRENRWFIFGIGVLMVVMGGMYFVYDLQKERIRARANIEHLSNIEQRQQQLIEALAALDEAYERGELKTTAYQKRRQRLRDELKQLLKD